MICECSSCQAEIARKERSERDRQAYERSLDEQFALVCAARDRDQLPAITKSEWLAGD